MVHTFSNDQIAQLFRNVAVAYTILDEKKYRFQILAYQKASELLATIPTQAIDLFTTNRLDEIPGIGASMRASIAELFTTGAVKHFELVLKDVPQAIFPLLDIPSFGPKKAYKLVSHFKLSNPSTVIDDVLERAQQAQIQKLEGFGVKSEQDIIRAIEEYRLGKTKTDRMVLPYASHLAEDMIAYLKKSPDVHDASVLGSLRRQKSTIGDVDIAVTSLNPQAVLDYFGAYPHKQRIIERGDITSSLLLSGGKQIDLMVLPPDSFGSLLQHFTGSKDHNIELREHALKLGYSLSEKGIKYTKGGKEHMQKFTSEKDFYAFLGLDWIPPEIRENTGEIQRAIKKTLPTLVSLSDIKGDLHIHSNYPWPSSHDYGTASMQEMIDRAIDLGYSYIGFSEHNPRVNNLSEVEQVSIMKKRFEHIEKLRKSNKDIRIFNLLETDILASGDLALSDKAYQYVDGILASIHSSFAMDRKTMTQRILKGLSHPKVRIFSHPTGRLLNKRKGYDADWDVIFPFVKDHDIALEINAWPERLDLPDTLVRQAKEYGIRFCIDTDSHDLSHMDNMRYGVSVVRRGWCTPQDIVNTYPIESFESWMLSV